MSLKPLACMGALVVGQLQAGFLGGIAAAAQQAAHPCQQLGKGEGLDQVIIGAQFQAVDAVIDCIACGQKQHKQSDTPPRGEIYCPALYSGRPLRRQ